MTKPLLFVALALLLAACSKPAPPVGKWEGGYESGGAGRDIAQRPSQDQRAGNHLNHRQPRADRRTACAPIGRAGEWLERSVAAHLRLHGKTFRKPGGIAPQMVWDKASNAMTLELFIGAKPALPIPLRPTDDFHENPFASG